MTVSLEGKLAALPKARQQKIHIEADRLAVEYMTLQDLRKAHSLTQTRLAEALGKSQVTIAQMERRGDLLLSTLRSYVEAMGGRLDLVAEFPGRAPVVLKGLADIESRSSA